MTRCLATYIPTTETDGPINSALPKSESAITMKDTQSESHHRVHIKEVPKMQPETTQDQNCHQASYTQTWMKWAEVMTSSMGHKYTSEE